MDSIQEFKNTITQNSDLYIKGLETTHFLAFNGSSGTRIDLHDFMEISAVDHLVKEIEATVKKMKPGQEVNLTQAEAWLLNGVDDLKGVDCLKSMLQLAKTRLHFGNENKVVDLSLTTENVQGLSFLSAITDEYKRQVGVENCKLQRA